MPTYQYACTACDHAFEQVQSFSEDSLTVCPRCEGRLRKVYNAVGVVFKGSGFYKTDSRGASTSGGSKGTDGAAEGSGSGAKDGSGTKESSGSTDKQSSAASSTSDSGGGSGGGKDSGSGGSSGGGSTTSTSGGSGSA